MVKKLIMTIQVNLVLLGLGNIPVLLSKLEIAVASPVSLFNSKIVNRSTLLNTNQC